MKRPLSQGLSIVHGGSYVPCCDYCGWVGKDYWTEGDALRAASAHSRSKLHRENLPAESSRTVGQVNG